MCLNDAYMDATSSSLLARPLYFLPSGPLTSVDCCSIVYILSSKTGGSVRDGFMSVGLHPLVRLGVGGMGGEEEEGIIWWGGSVSSARK